MDRLHVVGDPGDDLSNRGQVEKAHGQALDVLEELPTHFIDNALPHPLEEVHHPVVTDEGDQQRQGIFAGGEQEAGEPLLHRLAGGVIPRDEEVDGVAGQHGPVQLQSGQDQHQQQADCNGLDMGLEVGEHPGHDLALVVDVRQILFPSAKQLHDAFPPSSCSCFSSCCLSWMPL